MPTQPIPFVNAQRSGMDELGGATPTAMNVVADSTGTVRRRPGITETAEAPESVIDSGGIYGIHEALSGDLFAIGARSPWANIYRVTPSGADSLSPSAGEQLAGTERPVIAETEVLLVLAAGSYITKVRLDTLAVSYLGGSPPEASHVVANNLRLLANDTQVDRTKLWYSNQAISTDITGHEEWPGAGANDGGFFTAESRPDPVVAVGENTNEVFVWGSTTLQIFSPDPTLDFAPVASREVGCAAPYSIAKVDENFAWLDSKRRFVLSDGRGLEVIGADAIKRDLDDMATVSDCFGYRVLMGTVDARVWTFPTDGRTYVFQQGVGWGQWQSRLEGAWGQFPVTAHHLQLSTGKNLVGTADGRIGELSFTAQTDFGEAISAHVTTGFLDRGTSAVKLCNAVRVTLRRGEASGNPSGFLWWRNDLGAWEDPIAISLGASGEFQTTLTFYSLGSYRTRQWRFEFDGEATLILVRVEEDFTVLEA